MSKQISDGFHVPDMITQARKQGTGHNIIIEILIFILIFIIASIVESIFLLVPLFTYIFKDAKIQSIITSGGTTNYWTIYNYIMDLVSNLPSSIFILTLFATVSIILTVLIYCTKIEKRSLSTLGFIKKNIFSEYGKGLLIGFILFLLVIILNLITGGVKNTPSGFKAADLIEILIFFLGFVVQGASEEILCRGYLCVSVSRKYSIFTGIAVSSVAFSALHLGNHGVSVLALTNIVLFGLFMGIYMIKRGSLWGVCAIHSVWNFTQGNIFGMSVSGNTRSSALLSFENVEGKDIWNGGAFGPEGGICVTIVLTVALLILIFAVRDKEQSKTL